MNILTIVLRSLFSIAAIFLITRLLGRRQISQLSFFDYINGITIGSIAAELACDDSLEWYKPLIGLVVYGGVTFLISLLTDKSITLRRFLNGSPVLLIYKGVIQRKNLSRLNFDLSELQMECRSQGCFSLADVYMAVLESNGRVSVQPRAEAAPPLARDLAVPAAQEGLCASLVMDGRVMERNLAAAGFTRERLTRELAALGFDSPAKVMLAEADAAGRLRVIPCEDEQQSATVLE